MKLILDLALALALCAPGRAALLRSGAADAAQRVDTGTSLRAKVGYMVQGMLQRKHTTTRHIANTLHKKMKLSDALPMLEDKLPKDVTSLLHLSNGEHAAAAGQFSEVSLAKGRVYLNNMMYDAWLQLDQIEVECKEFEESNRMVFSQVVTDLEHLGSDLADKERMKSEAEGGIADMQTRINSLEGALDTLKRGFQSTREKNAYELSLRQDDQDVFTAILQLSKCPNAYGDDTYSFAQQFQVCDTGNGTELVVNDSSMSAKLKRSPRVQKVLEEVLGAAESGTPSLLQIAQAPPPQRVKQPKGGSRKCLNGIVNCGYLHDIMALEWGKFKDLVDELTYIMQRNRDAYEGEKENMNEQIATLRSNKMKFTEMLSEAISEINSLTAATREKQQQHRDIERAFTIKMADCKKRMSEILYTNICGTRTVRNALMRYSAVSPTHSIKDCDVTDWSAGPCTADGRGNSRSVDCDDSCPADVGGVDVDTCGGLKYLTRQVIISPNSFGMACPPLFFERTNGTVGMKCNQFHCPVHCLMSEWSGWSGCSKECGGGAQGQTRSILVKPKNGGTECDTTLEEQPCNTESCDRDCTLMPWTAWEPCSMACGGGIQERVRKVDIPIRANGKCPGSKHPDRFQMQQCNTQDCVGDEICIARQDLVIALDGSGSVKQEGFDIIKNFALNLTSKYQSTYYGVEDMRIGLVLFGNGEYFDNGTVAPALEVVSITSDLDSVSTAIEGLQWQRGFTNMMQALKAADNMFADGRDDAQSAVMMISDGKWTNAYRTTMLATAMKDKGVQIFMAPIAETTTQNLVVLRGWASDPWETNYERIPGLTALVNNEPEYAQKLLVKFCPRAFSPSAKLEEEQQQGYLKIHEEGYPSDSCGRWRDMGRVDSAEACMERVKEAGILAFAYESGGLWAGTCYSEAIDVTDDLWNQALASRVDLSCPGGAWVNNEYASTYIMNPSMFGDLFDE
ncbi:unnamed protein product [Prorocentrum cordatum]|uniref:VWFA domain-containing protein n=1 Tax=Prorocentrum cordatum TaxID=2364126 RepID=A0ABN9S3Y8_9DINO|nr:unnamed protein product [Polarella glacialis]